MMLLEGKTAIVYGAAGAVGSAVAQAFAREGAALHLTGHHLGAVQALADQVAETTGVVVQTAQVDALNPGAVERHAPQWWRPVADWTSRSTSSALATRKVWR
jgi:short-subunit dehydrogenase